MNQEKVVKRNAVTLSPAETTDYSFDDEGRTKTISSLEGTISYGYDDATGWHTQTVTSFNGQKSGDLSYEYDVFGRLNKITTTMRGGVTPPQAEETTYTYRDTGVLDEVFTTAYGSNVAGLKTQYSYDALLRPVREEHDWVLDDDSVLPIAIYEYAHRADGKISQVTESERSGMDKELAVGRTDYKYDGVGRLVREVTDGTFGTGGLPAVTTTVYDYDLVGNRTRLFRDTTNGTQQHPTETVTYSYDVRDELEQETSDVKGVIDYSYLANGELVGQEGQDKTATYTYDQRGRMTGAIVTQDSVTTTLTYVYNESGSRTRITQDGVTKSLLVDSMNPTGYAQVVEERVLSQLVAAYVYGLEPLLQMQQDDSGWEVTRYLSDQHSGVRQLLSSSGDVAKELYRYDAYGNQIQSTHGNPNDLLYRGERYDQLLALTYLRARFYNPSTGRFTSRDAFLGTTTSPLSYNKYIYAQDDAINGIDPSGRELVSLVSSLAIRFLLTTLDLLAVFSLYKIIKRAFLPIPFIDAANVSPFHKDLARLCKDVYNNEPKGSPGWKAATPQDLAGLGLAPDAFSSGAFVAQLYFSGKDYVLAFRGTDDGPDWWSNIAQGITGPLFHTQYWEATALANKVDRAVRGRAGTTLTITGHSLGGGLAAAGALQTNRPAVTFNAAGLNSLSELYYGVRSYTSRTVNYSVEGEILTESQSYGPAPEPFGELYLLKPAPIDAQSGPIELHKMYSVLRALGI